MGKFLNPEEYNIDNVFSGKYLIPIFQRPYSWGRDEVQQFLDDIDATYKLSITGSSAIQNEEMLLFAGTLFIKTQRNIKNVYTEYYVVDGQQRITTFTLMLMVLLNHFYQLKSEDEIVISIENYLWKRDNRKRSKNLRVLTLGNIDKEIMNELFDELYAKNNIIDFATDKLTNSLNSVEENLLNNLLLIEDCFNNRFPDENVYYNYFDYIRYNIRFITIEVHTNLGKLFSIFESINSKGKPLEEIDKIKGYIFQNINGEDYDEYLKKWGNLIIETSDNLMDYLTIYVRANISYYRNSIKLNNFMTLVRDGFMEYFNTDSIRETLLKLIDDMIVNVKYYKMLSDSYSLKKAGMSNRNVVYFMMNDIMDYNHTKALYFKALLLKNKNNLSQKTFENLIEQSFRFIFTFQSICSRESKQTLEVFIDVQNEIYKKNSCYYDKTALYLDEFESVINTFKKRIYDSAINKEAIRNNIKSNITYKRSRKAVRIILSYLECSDDNKKVDYDKLYWLLETGKDVHIDHIIPLNPNQNDANYKYYVNGDSVYLKDGQDFILQGESNILGKDEFYDDYIHVLGNLRLVWANENIKKSNKFITLEEFDDNFNSSSQISKRTSFLIKKMVDSNLLMSIDNIGEINKSSSSERLYDIIEFDKRFRYQDYSPVSFEFIGEKYILEKHNYTQLLCNVMDILYDLESEKFKELAIDKYRPMTSDRVYISNSKDDIVRGYTVNKNVHVETNLSSSYIIKFIYILIKEIGLNNNDIKISLKKK